MAFFAPSGLGVQDMGYMAFFTALGLPDAGALGAAFVLLKRSKEILWVAIGYLLLFLSGVRAKVAEAVPSAQAAATLAPNPEPVRAQES
jgi:hypothetical protein